MSLERLIASLKESEQRQIEEIWRQARLEAENVRKETAETIAVLRKTHEAEMATARVQCMHAILADADSTARNRELLSNEHLAAELFEKARKSLSVLRTDRYEDVFLRLAGELPPCNWQEVTVAPQDADIAHKTFPGAAVKTASTICGGLLVAAEQGRIVIDNTFNKRLERHWNFLLPRLVMAIEELCVRYETADQSA